MDRPDFMDFALQEFNGDEWITVAWFVYFNQAIACTTAFAGPVSHFRVIDARDGNTWTPKA